MVNAPLDPKVLGQLLLMQSILNSLPDKKSIFSFICRGMVDIPGIVEARYAETGETEDNDSQIIFEVQAGETSFGFLLVTLSDIHQFRPYEQYLRNFIFMTGIILEERKQREINNQHQKNLEKRILERTRELTIEKDKLIESQRRFTDLMKNVNLLSVMLDVEGNIIFCNDYLLRLTHYNAKELSGKNWFQYLVAKESAGHLKDIFGQMIRGENTHHHFENNIITKNGDVLIISWNNTLLRNANQQIIGTASIGENITERKKAEEALIEKNREYKYLNEEYSSLNEELTESLENLQFINSKLEQAKLKAEESDRLKTAFLQNMSHEIRTPMNAIMGFSNLLPLQFHNREKLVKYSEIINQRCNDLLDIINDILDIAKIESGQLEINPQEFYIVDLISEISDFFSEYRKRISKEHLSFQLSTTCGPEVSVVTDKIKVKQILINLINNALKFTLNGSVTGECTLEGKNLLFTIKDTGVGIPDEKLQIIFDRFIQISNPKIKNPGGTGLGLSIVKGLIDLLGGKMMVESEPDFGTTFRFSVPVEINSFSQKI